MNKEMGLKSIVRRRKPGYTKGHPYKLFRNILEQDFTCDEINTKWCTDFTYLYLSDGSKRYNCTIIDLHDRSVVASITDRNITSELAIRTLRKAIESQSEIKGVLILHSDHGSQYTSKDFTEYCKRMAVTQNMSKAGYPYDNAPMERYFNTLYRARYPQRMKSKGQAVYAEKECPRCGANFIPDQDGCCSYCGYRLPIDNSKWRILEQ